MQNKKELLKWYKEMGIEEIVTNKPIDRTVKMQQKQKIELEESTSPKIETTTTELSNSLVEKAKLLSESCTNLEQLRNVVTNFKELSIAKTATNTVFSDGNPNAKIMVIGEAPGANEDEQGIPFCGQSGKLMDKMFYHIGWTREKNLYITNSIFWRPPGNRRPTNEENAICLPFVEKHIALLDPTIIILVGSTAAQALLSVNQPISKLRENTHNYYNHYLNRNIPSYVIFHPSYLLRQPSQKQVVWYDLLKIRKNAAT